MYSVVGTVFSSHSLPECWHNTGLGGIRHAQVGALVGRLACVETVAAAMLFDARWFAGRRWFVALYDKLHGRRGRCRTYLLGTVFVIPLVRGGAGGAGGGGGAPESLLATERAR